jgi:hypothetical protein
MRIFALLFLFISLLEIVRCGYSRDEVTTTVVTPSVASSFRAFIVGGNTLSGAVSGLKVDSNANVIAWGQFNSATLSYSGTPYSFTAVDVGNTYDDHVVSYASTGAFQWARLIQSSDADAVTSVRIGSDNSIYVYGSYMGATLFVYDESHNLLGSLANAQNGMKDLYLLKFSSSGTLLAGVRFSSVANEANSGMEINPVSGYIVVTGTNENVATVANLSGTTLFTLSNPAAGFTDAFYVSFTPDLALASGYRFSSTDAETAGVPTIGTGGLGCVNGVYANGANMEIRSVQNVLQATLTNAGSADGYVAGFNADGSLAFASHVGNANSDNMSTTCAVSASNVVAVTGLFQNAAMTIKDMNNNTLGNVINNAGTIDSYMASFTSSGALQSVVRFGSAANENSINDPLFVGSSVAVSGRYQGALTIFDGSNVALGTLNFSLGVDHFGVVVNSTGTAVNGYGFESTGSDVYSMTTDSFNNVYLVGTFTAALTVQVISGGTAASHPAPAGTDATFTKLSSSGALLASYSFSSAGTDAVNAPITTPSGHTRAVGQFQTGSVTIYNGVTGTTLGTLSNAGGVDGFFADFDTSGALSSAYRFGSSAAEAMTSGFSLFPSGTGSEQSVVCTTYGAAMTVKDASGTTLGTTAYSASTDAYFGLVGSSSLLAQKSANGSGSEGLSAFAYDPSGLFVGAINTSGSSFTFDGVTYTGSGSMGSALITPIR